MAYGNPGVIPLRGIDADAERDEAGQKAIQDQEPGSEFTVVIPEDLQACHDRLDEIREELGVLMDKLYNVAAGGIQVTSLLNYKGTPSQVKLAIRYEMDCLYAEESLIQAQVEELMYAGPPMDADNDAEEDAYDKGDATQPIKTYAGPARDSATQIISPDPDHGRNV